MKAVFILLTVILLSGIACNDNRSPFSNDPPKDANSVEINGLVESIVCFDLNLPIDSQVSPYAISFKQSASLRFIKNNGTSFSFTTNDSSLFTASIDTGIYSIVIESGHTFPDTLPNIRLVNDTIMDILIQIDYLSSDSINLYFSYDKFSDTLGQESELQFLESLNGQLNNALILTDMKRKDYPWPAINYRVSIRDGIPVWAVSEAIRKLMEILVTPPNMTLSADPDFFACLD